MSETGDVSAWKLIFTIHEGGEQEPGQVHVGAELDDGTYIHGRLFSYADDLPETSDRDFVLSAPIEIRDAKGETHKLGCQFSIVSARRVRRIDVTHLLPSEG